jgi:hypothetical protein
MMMVGIMLVLLMGFERRMKRADRLERMLMRRILMLMEGNVEKIKGLIWSIEVHKVLI